MTVELTTPVLITIRAETSEEAEKHLHEFIVEHSAAEAYDPRLRISTSRLELNR